MFNLVRSTFRKSAAAFSRSRLEFFPITVRPVTGQTFDQSSLSEAEGVSLAGRS